jgi:uncharacterized protein
VRPIRIGPWACALGLSAACAAPDTDTLRVASTLTGETYRLDVLSPVGAPAADSLPAVWVLDGHYHFDALARHVDRGWERGELAPLRLVGVSYDGLEIQDLADLPIIAEKRVDDLSYPADPYFPGGGGQADVFHEALETELLPAVEAAYVLTPGARTLMGHSLGGLFVMLDALRFGAEGSVFSAHVSASPSVSWSGGALLDDEAAYAASHADLDTRLVIGTGTLEGTEMNASKAALVGQLRGRAHPSLRITETDPKAGHMQAAEVIFEDALAELHP